MRASSETQSDGGTSFFSGQQGGDSDQMLVDYVRRRLWEGKGADGGMIGRYAESTKRIKQKKGLPTDRVTLFHTGRFYSSLWLNASKDALHLHYQEDPYKHVLNRYSGAEKILQIRFRNEAEKRQFLNKLILCLKKR